MKRSSATLKTLARESLNGNFGLPIVACLISGAMSVAATMVITGFLDTFSMVSIITNQILLYVVSLFISLITAGYNMMLLNLNRRKPYSVGNIFYVFSHSPDRFLIVNLLLLLAGILVSLPFDIASYRTSGMESLTLTLLSLLAQSLISILLSTFFGLSNYLLLDNPELGAIDSMKESLRLMKGNKGRYLYLYFSFLPLSIACIFSCYIGFLWLTPYIQTTMAFFYMDITGELDMPKPVQGEIPGEPPFGNFQDRYEMH